MLNFDELRNAIDEWPWFPYRQWDVKLDGDRIARRIGRGFPTDNGMLNYHPRSSICLTRRGFPTDNGMLNSKDHNERLDGAVVSLQTMGC